MDKDNNRKHNRKKALIIIAVIFGLIVAVLAGIAWWQRDNLEALYLSFKYSNTQIDEELINNNKKVEDYLNDNPQYNVRPSTPLEEELHKNGVIDDNEFTKLITGQTTIGEMFGTELDLNGDKKITVSESGSIISTEEAKELKDQTNHTDSPPGDSPGASEDNSAEISEQIAQLYVLKSAFSGQLDALYNEAVAYYVSLPADKKSEGKTEVAKLFYSKGASLEAECDAKVNAILVNIEKLLKEDGSDTTLVTKVRDAYNKEKSLKKAYYIDKLTS